VLDRVIVDKNVVIGRGTQLGSGDDYGTPNAAQPDRLYTGITVVGKGAHIPGGIRIGRNVVIQTNTREQAFAPYGEQVPNGATV
jgi:glucose-1-phosphate adenylyltransferase